MAEKLFARDGADALAVAAETTEIGTVEMVGIETRIPSADRVFDAERRCPIVSPLTYILMQRVGVAITRSGQEDGLAIRHADYPDSHHAVQRGPFPHAIVEQFRPLVDGRCTPATAPEHVGNVVGRLKGLLSVGNAIGRV